MSSRQKLEVKIGAIVLIDFTSIQPTHRKFKAEVTQVSENDLGQKVITYRRMDAIRPKLPICNASYVTAIVMPAPYVVERKIFVNAFANDVFTTMKKGGLRIGSLEYLVMEALSTVKHVELKSPINDEHIALLFEKACWPGQVYKPDNLGMIAVRWKIFKRWVHKNAQRLVYTKAGLQISDVAFHKRKDIDDRPSFYPPEIFPNMEDIGDDELDAAIYSDSRYEHDQYMD